MNNTIIVSNTKITLDPTRVCMSVFCTMWVALLWIYDSFEWFCQKDSTCSLVNHPKPLLSWQLTPSLSPIRNKPRIVTEILDLLKIT